jgi:hypothetical protein
MNNEIKRLNIEDFIWIVFAILCIINIIGDYNEKEYIKLNNKYYKNNADKIFTFTLTITLLIYLYFFIRNYYVLEKATDKKRLYEIKVLGSILLIIGIICLLYFQKKQTSFEGSPAL